MNSTAIKEAVATGYPRDKMYGVWWSGAEPDVEPAGDGAKGYNALVFLAPAGQGAVHADILKHVHDKGQGTGKKEDVGDVLYNRGMTAAMMTVEAVRRAQAQVRQEAAEGRGSALGPGEPRDRRGGDQAARLRGLHDADPHDLHRSRRRQHLGHPHLGRQEVGRCRRTATCPTSRSSSR